MSLWRSYSWASARRGLPIAPRERRTDAIARLGVGRAYRGTPTYAPCKSSSGMHRSPPPNGIARWTIPKSVRRWWRRYMSAVLRLVDNTGGGGELSPLEAWELFMRGAGRAERTVRDGVWRPCNGRNATPARAAISSRRSTCRGSSPTPTSERRRRRPTSVRSARSIAGGQRKAARTSLPGCRGRARRSYRRGRCRGRAYHEAVCGCVERSDMTTKKICFHCYSELFPDKPIRKVTLGRQCVVCKNQTDKVEQMVPVEAEDL